MLEVLESLQPPVLTLTLLSGLVDVLAAARRRPRASSGSPPSAPLRRRQRYTTLLLGDFSGRDVKRVIRRAIAESLLRRDAPDAASWPRE